MIQQKCPVCGQVISLDDSNYYPYERVSRQCGLCGTNIEFEIPAPAPIVPPKGKEQPKELEKEPLEKNLEKQSVDKKTIKPVVNPKPSTASGSPGIGSNVKIILGVAIFLIVILLVVVVLLLTKSEKSDSTSYDKSDFSQEVYDGVNSDQSIVNDLQEDVFVEEASYDMYVCAMTSIIRSKPTDVSNKNAMDTISYGTKLPTYLVKDGYAKVYYKGHNGYVPLSDICNQQDLDLLNSLWGDEGASESFIELRYRRALIVYFNDNNFPTGKNGWQFYSGGDWGTGHTLYFSKIYNVSCQYPDMYVLLSNRNTGQSRLIVFSFDDETEDPIYRVEYNISSIGNVGIRSVKVDPKNENLVLLTFTTGDSYSLDK